MKKCSVPRESQVIKMEIHIYKNCQSCLHQDRLCLNSVDIEAKSLTNLLIYSQNILRRKEKCNKSQRLNNVRRINISGSRGEMEEKQRRTCKYIINNKRKPKEGYSFEHYLLCVHILIFFLALPLTFPLISEKSLAHGSERSSSDLKKN